MDNKVVIEILESDWPDGEMMKKAYQHAIDTLQQIEDGKWVKLPCKVGDTVYCLEPDCNESKCKYWHEGSDIFRDDPGCGLDYDEPCIRGLKIVPTKIVSLEYLICVIVEDFGKTVFLTRKEAEKALKAKGGSKS